MLPESATAEKPPAIKRLNDVHLQMVDYLSTHPGCTLEELNAFLGGRYTIGWLSQVINSDAFQARLAEARIELFGDTKQTIKDRLHGIAHSSLKRLEERIPVETDISRLGNVADLALKSLGYGPKPQPAGGSGGNQTNVFVGTVDKSTLEAARSIMHKPHEERIEKVLNPPHGVGPQALPLPAVDGSEK